MTTQSDRDRELGELVRWATRRRIEFYYDPFEPRVGAHYGIGADDYVQRKTILAALRAAKKQYERKRATK